MTWSPAHLDVTLHRADPAAPPGQITVIRLLALLPADWCCHPDAGTDLLRLRLAPVPTDPEPFLTRALADPALCGWGRVGQGASAR
ncbi:MULTISPECIES: hypothetical protein [Streptomyces]|uniref:Uncharacterized protein n=4 Tax=Streptomyces TaxID=1883 RepID=A0A8H9HP85_9ACTN|nr:MULTISPECIES: hypothetical protein [Streptomyces]NEE54841.1 hypothetical protein [Streptomyces sp. SID8455]MBL3804879.1 hypothetical protein [Streptomyces sp. BRB081]MDQ0293735.1 hypothetical protein [Streptomyces sp. DSM 41037]PJM81767.1 hypothetical protein CH313_20680 [Streptomyces sp. TSRI0384-2]QNE82792.1 hypothetical protein F0345_18110 [Streptomyces rutgersensis]